jgi:tetratricopeptide (TPR) repeat protein
MLCGIRSALGCGLLLVAACHVPARTPVASSPVEAGPAGPIVAGTAIEGTTVDGGTFEIHILPPVDPQQLAAAEEAVKQQPGSAEAHAALGDELARQGRTDDALAEYAEAARLAPDDPVAHFRLGLTLHVVGDLRGALVSYRETVRLLPGSAFAHAAISLVHLRLGDPVEALREYRIVRHLDETLAEGLFEILSEEQELRQVALPAREDARRG